MDVEQGTNRSLYGIRSSGGAPGREFEQDVRYSVRIDHNYHTSLDVPPCTRLRAGLISLPKVYSLSHRMFRHLHEVLNID